MARRLRVSSAGVPEHLIQRGNNRQAKFACEEDMQAYVGWLKTYSTCGGRAADFVLTSG